MKIIFRIRINIFLMQFLIFSAIQFFYFKIYFEKLIYCSILIVNIWNPNINLL